MHMASDGYGIVNQLLDKLRVASPYLISSDTMNGIGKRRGK